MAGTIAEALRAVAGRGAALSVPLFAATGGFLTGGGSAANAMLMPMVTALARAIAREPEIIFFDEPTTGLDVTTQKTVMDLLAALG